MALQQREADLKKSARNILSVAEKDNRELSREENENYSKIVKALEANGRELAAETARLAAENSGEAMPDENSAFAAMARGEIPQAAHSAQQRRPTAGKCHYTDLFGAPAKGAFQNFGEFARAVSYSHQLFDPRLKMAATEDSPSGGGFLVPPDQAATVWDQILESEIVRPRATVIPMASESRKWPAVQDDDHSGGTLFGGMSMAGGWSSELEDLNLADLKVRLITLTVNKLGLLQNSSNELLEDAVFEGTLTKNFQEGAGWFLDNAFLFGSGAGQPLGMLSSGNLALVTVPKESGQAPASFRLSTRK
jgi:HK97 family phage major capsid protein